MKYILRKLTTLIITLFIVSLLAFLAFQVIPGSPASTMLGTNATPEAVAELEAELAAETERLRLAKEESAAFIANMRRL